MPTLRVVTDLDADVAEALDASLDLGLELVAGRRHRVRPVDAGPGSRTSGRIGLGERVRWSVRLYGIVPLRHTSEILELDEERPDGSARFVDAMVSGAFGAFRHEHDFTPLPPDTGPTTGTGTSTGTSTGVPRTRMTDAMTWRSPLGPLGRIADVVLVRRTLAGLLADRNAEIARRVTRPDPDAPGT